MHAYDEAYLDDARKNLGEALDYAVNACCIDPDEFWRLFLASGLAEQFGNGHPRFVSGLSGTELVMETLTKVGLDGPFPHAQTEYECTPEYWCGWILAYYQWKADLSFRNIYSFISIDDILKLYPTLHEASEEKFVDIINIIIGRKSAITRLQQQRNICGYSQRELSEKSGVNLRTLQQYEQNAKNISKASFQTVRALAQALGCTPDDILEGCQAFGARNA